MKIFSISVVLYCICVTKYAYKNLNELFTVLSSSLAMKSGSLAKKRGSLAKKRGSLAKKRGSLAKKRGSLTIWKRCLAVINVKRKSTFPTWKKGEEGFIKSFLNERKKSRKNKKKSIERTLHLMNGKLLPHNDNTFLNYNDKRTNSRRGNNTSDRRNVKFFFFFKNNENTFFLVNSVGNGKKKENKIANMSKMSKTSKTSKTSKLLKMKDKFFFFKLYAKMPVITVNRKLYPKEYSTDYEEVLRKFNVTYINYKTRLRSKKEIDIKRIDDLYGKIYDRDVLKKQFYFFLYHDDINTCFRVLNENRNVLTREESFKMLNSLPYIFVNDLKYVYPTEENVDEILSKLIKTYIFQYANDKNIDYLNFKYKYNELDEYCQQLEHESLNGTQCNENGRKNVDEKRGEKKDDNYSQKSEANQNENTLNTSTTSENLATADLPITNTYMKVEQKDEELSKCAEGNIYDDWKETDYEKRYKHMYYDYKIIESTKKYKELMEKFKKYPANIKLEKVQLLYTKILSMKGNKIYEGFRKHESVKKNKERKIYRNAQLTVDPYKLTPYMYEPIKYDKKKKEEINKLFEKYVEEKDLIKAAFILRKYTNLIDTKELKSRQTIKKFLRLHEYIYKCNKYNEKELAHLRMIYYSSVQKHRVMRKICEVGMREQGENVTHKEVYEKELNRYLEEREKLRDERMKKKNIDMDAIRDFSSAYSMEWLPVIYKDMFEQIEKEKNMKSTEKEKSNISRKKEIIKKLFPSGTEEKGANQVGDSTLNADTRINKKQDLFDIKDELKFSRNLLNYKKKTKGKSRRKKGKSGKGEVKGVSKGGSEVGKEDNAKSGSEGGGETA
ncbi:hypothetical protein MKS88_001666 [Plasmodium brasilianum]|uniref:Uncharacterized protein n=1 Tax=Plasmodium brasilianum TaxID=5824 RepID=A0ACB9YEG0_PLABR|nr:hypothetical protein MKS88_001666 [Plasmodium brasilianum]